MAALIVAWAALYLTWPFGQDQSAFAWVADVIRAGGLPYQDAWEVKGPLVYYMVAIANAAFGRNFWGIRVFDLLVLAAGMIPLYLVARTFASRGFALLGPALFLLWYAALNFENTAQPDGWAGVFLAGAAAALITGGRRPGPAAAIVAGALIGACTLFKPTYGMFLALPLLFGWAGERDSRGVLFRFWA
ncbi:MAG: glycosyltransferase family 39 protein, partial [Gemmatimonadetes bacterium]|nr:glycosyltransferase family 39 protein [Gemmatimonadota bacterium]